MLLSNTLNRPESNTEPLGFSWQCWAYNIQYDWSEAFSSTGCVLWVALSDWWQTHCLFWHGTVSHSVEKKKSPASQQFVR